MSLRAVLGLMLLGATCGVVAAEEAPTSPPVTLHIHNETRKSAFDKLGKAAHIQFESNNPRLFREGDAVSFDCDKVPFLKAFCELCAETSVSPISSGDGVLQVMGDRDGKWIKNLRTYTNDYIVTAYLPQANKSITFGRDTSSNNSTQLKFTMLCDPHLHPISYEQMHVDALTDTAGHPIKIIPQRFSFDGFTRGIAQIDLVLDPTQKIDGIGDLKISLNPVVATKFRTIEIKNIATPHHEDLNFNDVKVGIDVRNYSGQFGAEYTVEYTGKDALLAKRLLGSIGGARVTLVDAQGMQYMYSGGSYGPDGHNRSKGGFRFRVHPMNPIKPGPPDKIVWQFPIAFAASPVTFEFKDLSWK